MSKGELTYKEFLDFYGEDWSTCKPLDVRTIGELPELQGIYEVRTKNYSFPRLRGTSSVLYIGSATSPYGLKKRIKSLIKGRHIARKRIQGIAAELKIELEFRYKGDLQAKQAEKDALKEYENKHLELPPCNHNIPK